MSVVIEEGLMTLGALTADTDYDPELALEILGEETDGRAVLAFQGEQLLGGWIKVGDSPANEGATLSCVGVEWLLGGDGDIGPTERDKEYIAGNNKLQNPAFVYLGSEETTDALGDPAVRVTADWWKLDDVTGWVIAQGSATSTTALTDGLDLDPDVTLPGDILTSEDKFETKGGDLWRAKVTAQRLTGTIGHLRAHLVYDGHFRHPNLIAAPAGWTVTREQTADAGIVSGQFRLGPIAQPQYLLNTGFETEDFTNWVGDTSGTRWVVLGTVAADGNFYDPHSGSWQAIATDPTGTGTEPYRRLVNTIGIDLPKVGERYRVRGYVRETQKAGGEATIYLRWTRFGDDVMHRVATQRVRGSASYGTLLGALPFHDWQECVAEYEVATDISELTVELAADYDKVGEDPITGDPFYSGNFAFDDVTLERIKGNTATFTAPPIPVVGEESYTLKALVTPDAGVTAGEVSASFLFTGPGRPDQVIDGGFVDFSTAGATLLESPFFVPSGYNSVTVSLVGADILGGGFTVGVPTLSLLDSKRFVADLGIGPSLPALTTSTLNSTAPAGAEHVHLELIAEDKGDGYVVHSASLARAETPSTSAAVVKDIRTDPLDAHALLDAGNIVGPETIVFDWHVLRMTRRAQLQHLSRAGVALPEREWRIYVHPVTGRPTIDWGTPEAIFEDRRDLVFIEDDLKTLAPPHLERSGEGRVTRVEVVGADRQRPDGPPLTITGEATNDNSDFLDWDGNPLNRTQTIAEPSIDHPDYAAAFARYKADRANASAENVRMQISDWRAWGQFNVGDWVYVYKPEAGLEDPSNPMLTDDGRIVFPRKLRVISRTWRLGGGDFRLEIHRPGQENYVVPDQLVHWEPATTAELELGDPLPDFEVDSQGGAAGEQFRKFRASMPG